MVAVDSEINVSFFCMNLSRRFAQKGTFLFVPRSPYIQVPLVPNGKSLAYLGDFSASDYRQCRRPVGLHAHRWIYVTYYQSVKDFSGKLFQNGSWNSSCPLSDESLVFRVELFLWDYEAAVS